MSAYDLRQFLSCRELTAQCKRNITLVKTLAGVDLLFTGKVVVHLMPVSF